MRAKGDNMNKVSYHIDKLPPLTAKQQADLEYLATLSDDDIDLSDIPDDQIENVVSYLDSNLLHNNEEMPADQVAALEELRSSLEARR